MKEKQEFQIFIISRFLVSIIYVVLMEILIWFATLYIKDHFTGETSQSIFVLGIVLMILPIIIASVGFSKALVNEVNRMELHREELHKVYEKKRNLMLSDIAHDLRTPITTIAGYSKALNDNMVISEEKKKEYLKAIENKSVRMNDLITLLFEYVRLDSENYGLKKEEVDLPELLRTIAASLYSDIEEKGMYLMIKIPEEEHIISLDRVQFTRVIVNLINNAIKHNESGTTISLEMKLQKNHSQVILSDDGRLIPEFLAEHIFEPFATGDAARMTQTGSGLGLSIAKKIVEMHGWDLELKQYKDKHQKDFIISIK